jgi:hypothetical protein
MARTNTNTITGKEMPIHYTACDSSVAWAAIQNGDARMVGLCALRWLTETKEGHQMMEACVAPSDELRHYTPTDAAEEVLYTLSDGYNVPKAHEDAMISAIKDEIIDLIDTWI